MNEDKKIDLKLILSIVATGIMSFSGVVVETAMNVTFPSLMEEFQIGTSSVQWITTGYLLVLAVIIPTSSYLKTFPYEITIYDSNHPVHHWNSPGSCNTCILFAASGRLIQGVGTGIALPLMFNITMEQVPEEKLGVMMGTASLITAMAPAVGPSLGGFIVNHFGWRIVFIALLLFRATRHLPHNREAKMPSVFLAAITILILICSCGVFLSIRSSEKIDIAHVQ